MSRLFFKTYAGYGLALLLACLLGALAIAHAMTPNSERQERDSRPGHGALSGELLATADYDLDTSDDPDDSAQDYHDPDTAGPSDDD